jgi:hypothetical protein
MGLKPAGALGVNTYTLSRNIPNPHGEKIMNKTILLSAVFAALTMMSAGDASAAVALGQDDWPDSADAGNSPDPWGTDQMNFVPGSGDTTAIGTATGSRGVAFRATGMDSAFITSTARFVYVKIDAVTLGGLDLSLAPPGGAEFDFAEAGFLVGATNPGGFSSGRIRQPGEYVFDVASWSPASPVSDASVLFVLPGGSGQSFTVDNLQFRDDNPLAIPEASSWLMLATGLACLAGWVKRRRVS